MTQSCSPVSWSKTENGVALIVNGRCVPFTNEEVAPALEALKHVAATAVPRYPKPVDGEVFLGRGLMSMSRYDLWSHHGSAGVLFTDGISCFDRSADDLSAKKDHFEMRDIADRLRAATGPRFPLPPGTQDMVWLGRVEDPKCKLWAPHDLWMTRDTSLVFWTEFSSKTLQSAGDLRFYTYTPDRVEILASHAQPGSLWDRSYKLWNFVRNGGLPDNRVEPAPAPEPPPNGVLGWVVKDMTKNTQLPYALPNAWSKTKYIFKDLKEAKRRLKSARARLTSRTFKIFVVRDKSGVAT